MHRGSGLGQEVLDDDLLHVPVAPVGIGDGGQGVDAVLPRLTDPDQDPCRERDGQLACGLERGQPTCRHLVGRTAVAVEIRVERLQHHPLRRGDGAQRRELLRMERSGVGVGEQPGLVEDELGHGHEVVDGGAVGAVGQPLRGRRVPQLGSLAEREQRLMASRRGAVPSDGEDLLGRQVRGFEAGGRLGEGAVPALVLAQHGERDEDLRGEGDSGAERQVAYVTGLGEELFEGPSGQVGEVTRKHGLSLWSGAHGWSAGRVRDGCGCVGR